MALTIGKCNTDKTIILTQTKCNDTIRTWTAIRLKSSLLHKTILGSEDEIVVVHILLVIEVLHMDKCTNLITLLNIDHVLERTTLRLAITLWNIIHLDPIEATLLSEEHHRRVHISLVYILDKVFIACCTSLSTYSTTSLLTEISKRSTFDISEVRNSDNHIIICIHIFWIKLSSHLDDTSATLISILLLDLSKFTFNNLIAHSLAGEQFVEVLDEFLKFVVFIFQLFDTQSCQLCETHLNNSFRLEVIKIES